MKNIYEYGDVHVMYIKQLYEYSNEPRREKTCIERYASELRQPQMIDRALTEKTDLNSKNNGAGHMRGYPDADLRLCLRISKNLEGKTKQVFPSSASIVEKGVVYWDQRPFSYFCSKHKNIRLNASTVPQCEFDLSQLKPLNEPLAREHISEGF